MLPIIDCSRGRQTTEKTTTRALGFLTDFPDDFQIIEFSNIGNKST